MDFNGYLSRPSFNPFSDDLKKEVTKTVALQDVLFSLSYNSTDFVRNWILGTDLIYSSKGVFTLTHELLIVAIYRPKLQEKVVNLIDDLLKFDSDDNKLNEIKDNIGDFFAVESIHGCRYFFFFSECFRKGILSQDNLKNLLDEMINTQCFLAFCWFSPLIYSIDKQKYRVFFSLAKLSHRIDISQYISKIHIFSANNWKIHHQETTKGLHLSKIAICLINDDVETLQTFASGDFNLNQTIPPYIFQRSPLLNHYPTLIQYSAFHGSLNCFKYLLTNGALLDLKDADGMNLIQYAIMGGNIEIIRIIEQNNCSFNGAGQMAALYHHHKIFDWISLTKDINYTEPTGRIGSILSQCIFSNNIRIFLLCYEKGFDPNSEIYVYLLLFLVFISFFRNTSIYRS